MDFSLYTLSDTAEIILCIIGYLLINAYFFNQENKKLLLYWYSYHTLIIGAYILELPTIFFLSSCCFPVVLMLLMVLHEQRLQKMFVVAQRIDPLTTTTAQSRWPDELIKFALTRLNAQKDLHVVIEHADNLSTLVSAAELINADLKKNTLELLYDSLDIPKKSFLWITSSGKITSLTTFWKNSSDNDLIQITSTLDCIALHACAATRKFTIVRGAKILENLSAHHALALLSELHSTFYKKQENGHVTTTHFTSYNDKTVS